MFASTKNKNEKREQLDTFRKADFLKIVEISMDIDLKNVLNCCDVLISNNKGEIRKDFFRFSTIRVSPDGNCLFNSLLYYVRKFNKKYKNYDVNRLKKLVKSAKKDGEYGDMEDINKVQEKFNVMINVVISQNEYSKGKKNNDEKIDYQRVGRNEKCPCGSGKKFKHCHGNI